MSIWGAGAEQNDDAADWLADLAEEPTVVALNDAFDEVLNLERDDYLEVTEGAIAIAAAGVVAQLVDPQADFTLLDEDAVLQLQAQHHKLAKGAQRSLVKRALRCVSMVSDATRSELQQLVNEDTDIGQAWASGMQRLSLRLVAAHDTLK